jgi:arabinose-5-phosphate isomerase
VKSLVPVGKGVLKQEAAALLKVMEALDERFDRAVEMIADCAGRVVLMGIGKSGLIGRKIASTLSSVGSAALFLHPADSLHGDLGMLQKGDILFIISKSGETEEIIGILPWVKRAEIRTIVLTGNISSTIASHGDVVLEADVEEACPLNMVPTSSSTAALALGDALAVALMERRDFRIEDFANLHPGGTLGRKMLLRVDDLMHTGEAFPKVYTDTPMKDAILEITSKRLGVAGVFTREEEFAGVITDGDLRRAMEKYDNIMVKLSGEVMTARPKCITCNALAVSALKRMEDHSITSLFVLEKEGDSAPVGIIHIHDLLRAKIV